MQTRSPLLPDDTATVEGATSEPRRDDTGSATRKRRGQRLLGGLAVVAVAVVAAGFALDRYGADDGPPPPPAPLDAWAPYWTLETTLPQLAKRITSIREVSPFWYVTTGATTITMDPEASVEQTDEFLDIARDSNVAIIPSIRDLMEAGGMAAVLADPTTRAAHVDTIVAFAEDGDFDGIDLDYSSSRSPTAARRGRRHVRTGWRS